VRLFFAVELPGEARAVLARLSDANREYRWSDPSLLHVTLAFLGEQPEERLDDLQQIGADAASASRGGVLRLGNAGQFGGKYAPRVLWVDVAGDTEALLALQRRVDGGLRREGFSTEERPFRAHITLARRRESAHGGPPSGWPPEVEHAAFKLDQLTLMQSRLSPRGPTYTPVFQFPLAG
jgi:2'-5' RNA ligase